MHPTIMVVDDDVGILDAVQALLEDDGYPVIASAHPSSALNLATTDTTLPALILLDVLLSGSDGREVCRALKQAPRTQHIPIIMMSAHPNIRASVETCGANGFLPKPFDIDELLNMVQALLGR